MLQEDLCRTQECAERVCGGVDIFLSECTKFIRLVDAANEPHGCHAPSWLNPGEPSHTCIHLTTDLDLTQLNAPPHMGNVEYSLTQTSPTSMDISGQAGMVC